MLKSKREVVCGGSGSGCGGGGGREGGFERVISY